ncbi:hypothetical protein [Halopseudomonas maritima]|uniref:hypothetical protein n=1 Tax=Halopseudomonas maritima TaxID=2918528 RepID=UPI001EEC353F|nr:hypothetical protein [Halopseudomonas maritima]UJJ33081.1 BatD family protein [Halopseudomonas maritima]
MSPARILYLVLALALPASAAEPLLRLQSNAENGLSSGQALELELQVLVPSYFLAAPQFPTLQLDAGNQATPGASLNLSPRIDGQSWAGIQRSYRFAPLPPGDYQLHAGEVRVRYADSQRQPRELALPVPALRFSVSAASSAPSDTLAPQLRLTERYTPARTDLQVGDVLLRRLRIELDEAGSLLPPALPLSAPPGTRLYRSPPQLDQQGERVIQRYTREEEVRYLLLESGELEIPALTLQWRDTRNGQLQQLSLPARRLQVAPLAAVARHPVSIWQHLALLLAPMLLIGNALACSDHGRRWWRRRRLHRCLRAGTPRAALQALQSWLDCFPADQQAWLRRHLHSPIGALQAACYGEAAEWQPDALRLALQTLPRRPAPATCSSAVDWRLNP